MMANITLSYAPYEALGAPPPLPPTCDLAASAPHWRAIWPRASAAASLASFQPLTTSYYARRVLQSSTPHLAFVGVALVAWLAFLAWRAGRAACCCGGGTARARARRWAGQDGAAAAPRRVLGSRAHKAAVGLGVACCLLAAAAAAYGMSQAEPRALDVALAVLQGGATPTVLQGGAPPTVRGLLVRATRQLADVGTAMEGALVAVQALGAAAAETAAALDPFDPAAAAAAQAADDAASVAVDLRTGVDGVASASDALTTSVVGGLDENVAAHLPLARKVDAGRLGVIYGLFGLVILCSACAALAAARGVPAGLAAGVGLSLTLAALLALLAAPLAASTLVATDTCAYVEPLALSVAVREDGALGVVALADIFYGPAAAQDLKGWLALEGPASAFGVRSLGTLADTTQDVLKLGLADLAVATDDAAAKLGALVDGHAAALAPALDPAFTAATAAVSAALGEVGAAITALDTTLSAEALRALYARVKGVLCCTVGDGLGDLWWATALTAGLALVAAAPLCAVLARLDGLPPLPAPLRRANCWCGGGWRRRRASEGEEEAAGHQRPHVRGGPAGAVTAAWFTAAVASPPPSGAGAGSAMPCGGAAPPPSNPLSPQGSGVPLVRGAAPSAPPLAGPGTSRGSPPVVPPAAWPVRPASHSSPPHWAKYPKI